VHEAELNFWEGEKIASRLEWGFNVQVGGSAKLDDLLDQAKKNRLEKDFKDAETYAALGFVPLAEAALRKAESDASRYSLPFDHHRVKLTLNIADQNRLENTFINAERDAFYGRKTDCVKSLREAEGYAKAMKVPFDSARALKIKASLGKKPAPGSKPPFSIPWKLMSGFSGFNPIF
jgi:hypothetical protein